MIGHTLLAVFGRTGSKRSAGMTNPWLSPMTWKNYMMKITPILLEKAAGVKGRDKGRGLWFQ